MARAGSQESLRAKVMRRDYLYIATGAAGAVGTGCAGAGGRTGP